MKQSIKFPYNVFISSFKPKETIEERVHRYEIKLADVVFSNSGIDSEEVELDKLALVSEVNCSATMYRKCFISDSFEYIEFEVPKNKLRDKYSIDTMIVAKEELVFKDYSLEKGMPLAHLGSYLLKIAANQEGLITFAVSEKKQISYSFGSDIIKVNIPKKEYEDLLLMQNNIGIEHLLASQFAQIALIQACSYLKEGSDKDHLAWYKELLERWRRYDPEEKDYPSKSEEYIGFINSILDDRSLAFAKYLINQAKLEKDE